MPRKRGVKRTGKSSRGKTATKRSSRTISAKQKLNLAWSNFTMFIVLLILSLLLYGFLTNPLLKTFFGILSTLLGFVALAFLIILIVLGISTYRKRR